MKYAESFRLKEKTFTTQTVNIRQCEPAGKQRDEHRSGRQQAGRRLCLQLCEGMWDKRTIRGAEAGREGEGGLRTLTCGGGPTKKSTGVAQLGFNVSPIRGRLAHLAEVNERLSSYK